MKHMTMMAVALSLSSAIVAAGACASGGTGSGDDCTLSTDCAGNEVCVRVGSTAQCTINCTVSANECGGEASCEGVGSVGVNVCQEKKPEPSADNPPDPEEEPYLPCGSDAECGKLASGAVCAEWKGSRDCTITCSADAECNPPAVGGIGTSFFGCKPDASDTTRTVCLPREECFDDPLSCITGLPNEATGSTGASPTGDFGGF